MKKWDNRGKLKALILIATALLNLVAPVGNSRNYPIFLILTPLLFASFAVPLLAKAANGREFVRPTWNDNPLNLIRPLPLIHFGAFFFVILGFSVLAGSGLKYQALNPIGLTSISFGFGLFVGIHLTLLLRKRM